MPDISGIGAYGIHPFMSEDVLRQIKYANIKTKAGRIAYLITLGEKAPKPKIEEGVDSVKGALKWVNKFFEEKEEF